MKADSQIPKAVPSIFRNTIIIYQTSNIGSNHLLDTVVEEGEISEDTKQIVMRVVHQYFKPEIINRMDDIVIFTPLYGSMKRITQKLLDDLNRRLDDQI
ncbi:AAA family ATPase [Salinicoccus siamensis]|uniref:AAA family ATPase n=1 Tax=Salinicoccus siamensis TaxID=381830 RepID=UPI00361AE634